MPREEQEEECSFEPTPFCEDFKVNHAFDAFIEHPYFSSQVPFTEEVCKIVLVNTCNPVTVTECNDVTKNVRLTLSTSTQHHHNQQKHMLNSSAAFQV